MINFNYYTDDAFELYKKAVAAKKDKDGKKTLELIENNIKTDYENYQYNFNRKNVHLLNSNANLSSTDKKLLKQLYGSNKKIIKHIRTWIDNNNKRTYLHKCPYCTINRANTTEHILPKDKYPEYAVDALNLLPCCSECNSLKGENVRNTTNEPLIINFYYNKLPNIQYLFVDLIFDSKGNVDFDYKLENNNNIDEKMFHLLDSHFSKLNLLQRYKNEAINNYSEIENCILECFNELKDIDKCLNILKKQAYNDATQYGNNHWKVTLKLALANSVEYKEYLKNK